MNNAAEAYVILFTEVLSFPQFSGNAVGVHQPQQATIFVYGLEKSLLFVHNCQLFELKLLLENLEVG